MTQGKRVQCVHGLTIGPAGGYRAGPWMEGHKAGPFQCKRSVRMTGPRVLALSALLGMCIISPTHTACGSQGVDHVKF